MISFLDKPHFSGSNTGKIKRIKGHVLTGFTGGLGEQRVPQQGRLRHEVASKHRACQTPSTKLTTGNRKRFSGMIGF